MSRGGTDGERRGRSVLIKDSAQIKAALSNGELLVFPRGALLHVSCVLTEFRCDDSDVVFWCRFSVQSFLGGNRASDGIDVEVVLGVGAPLDGVPAQQKDENKDDENDVVIIRCEMKHDVRVRATAQCETVKSLPVQRITPTSLSKKFFLSLFQYQSVFYRL